MKNVFLLLFACLVGAAAIAQTDSTQPTYKRFPSVPPFKLLLQDSSSYFTKSMLAKKEPVLIMLFSPDCEHCQHESEEIIKNIDAFKKTQIVMATTRDFGKMVEFIRHYQLDRFDNITVGKDAAYMLPVYYDIRNLPFLAFYDKRHAFISVFEGAMPIEKIIAELKK